VAATEPLLATRGEQVSTRELAVAAGVAEGTIFRVFPTKDALIDAVVEDAFDMTSLCVEIGRIDLTLDLEARLLQVAELLHGRLVRVFALFHTLMTRRAHPHALRGVREKQERERRLVQTAVAAVLAPDAPRLRVAPEEAATLLNAMLMSAAHPLVCGEATPHPRQIVQVLLHGILAPARSPDGSRGPAC
jgi:AcrR family transcriptional regulator